MQAFIIFSILLLNSVAYANTEQELAPVTIIAEQKDELVNIPIIGFQQRIDRDYFSSTYMPLDELLEQQAGIDIQSVGGNGQYASPTIRGSTGKQVLVFWDGLLINDLNGSSADIGSLSLSSAGKVDIYRGMAPLELSPTAVGGAINIHSNQLNSNSGESSLTLGSFNTLEWSLSQNISKENAKVFFNINHFKSENNFEYLEEKPVNSPQNPAIESRKNNAVNNTSLLVKGDYQHNQSLRFDTAVQLQNNIREIASRINTSLNTAYLEQDNMRLQAATNYESDLGKSNLRFSHQKSDELYNDENNRVGVGSQYNVYKTDKNSLFFKHEFLFLHSSIVFVSSYEDERVTTDFPHEEIIPDDCSSSGKCSTNFNRIAKNIGTRIALPISDDINFMLQASRFQYTDKNDSNDPDELINSNNVSNTYDSGLNYHLTPTIEFYLKHGKQVRPATSSELFGDKGTSKGNADLISEKSKYNELGFSYMHKHFQIDSSIYQRVLNDAIIPSQDSRGIISFENAAKTQHLGIEVTSLLNWNDHWTSNFNLTLQDNEIVDHSNHSFIGNQVADYSRIHSFFSTSWKKNELLVKSSYTYQGGGFYNSLNTSVRDTKHHINLSFVWQETNWVASLEGKNLNSNRAKDYPHTPEPGRQYYFKFTYQW